MKSRIDILKENGFDVPASNMGWSFVNEKEKKVCFSGWEDLVQKNGEIYILSASWMYQKNGALNPSYKKSVEHVRRIVQSGYKLFIIPLIAVDVNAQPRKIKSAQDKLIPCELIKKEVAEFYAKILPN